MAYDFYLDGLRLPFAPGKLSLQIKNQNETVTLLNEGEVNLLKTPGLTEAEFEFTLPQSPYPFADPLQDAAVFLERLEALKTKKKPFQFLVSRASPSGRLLFDTNLTVSLEEYAITEDAENGLDLTVSVRLKQYRPFGIKTAAVQKQEGKPPKLETSLVRPVSKIPAKTYTVQSGDCLWNICKKELGDPLQYPRIAQINGISNPNRIMPGQVIQLEV